MHNAKGRDFLDELCYDIQKKDLIKGTIVLSKFKDVDNNTQRRALFEISRAEDDYAIPLLLNLIARHTELADAFPQIKETLFSKILDSPHVLLEWLDNGSEKSHRRLAVKIIAEIRLQSAVPMMLDMLRQGGDNEIIASVILALGTIGDPSACRPVSEHLYSYDKALIFAAIYCLEQLGTPTAIQRLAERIDGKDAQVDFRILDGFARIQSTEALEKLNDVLGSHYAHLRVAAKQKLSEIGLKAVPILLKNLLHNDPDLLIHTLNVLGEIGDAAAVPAIRKLLHNEPKNPNVRFAAYEALGMLPLQKGAFALAAGLEDPVVSVRAVAAKTIDRHFNMVLAAGIKNMLRDRGPEAENIILTILDSQCDTIFLSLIKEDFFQEPAMAFLRERVHPDVRTHFVRLLEQNGFAALARQIIEAKKPIFESQLKVFAVDDSRMILSIYRGMLHHLGHDPHLFEFPTQALEEIQRQKPDVILTDLNMPVLSGIELTKGVRQWFSKDDLPIIMVTTQNDFQDNAAAVAAGVNAILYKPFTEEQIEQAIETHVKKQGGRPKDEYLGRISP